MHFQRSFQQLNVQQFSDSALAEYHGMLKRMLALTEPPAGVVAKK